MDTTTATVDCACGPAARLARALAAAALAVALALAPGARAEEPVLDEGGHFEVRSAFLEPAEHVYQLNATLSLAFSRAFQQAVREGVPVAFELDIRLDRKRRLLPDSETAQLVQRWQLHYHALSERYVVNNLNSGQQASFPTLGAALATLEQVRGLPVVDEALVEKGEHYEASIRAVATIEGGLPSALKAMMFWIDWKRATDWYTWSVRP